VSRVIFGAPTNTRLPDIGPPTQIIKSSDLILSSPSWNQKFEGYLQTNPSLRDIWVLYDSLVDEGEPLHCFDGCGGWFRSSENDKARSARLLRDWCGNEVFGKTLLGFDYWNPHLSDGSRRQNLHLVITSEVVAHFEALDESLFTKTILTRLHEQTFDRQECVLPLISLGDIETGLLQLKTALGFIEDGDAMVLLVRSPWDRILSSLFQNGTLELVRASKDAESWVTPKGTTLDESADLLLVRVRQIREALYWVERFSSDPKFEVFRFDMSFVELDRKQMGNVGASPFLMVLEALFDRKRGELSLYDVGDFELISWLGDMGEDLTMLLDPKTNSARLSFLCPQGKVGLERLVCLAFLYHFGGLYTRRLPVRTDWVGKTQLSKAGALL